MSKMRRDIDGLVIESALRTQLVVLRIQEYIPECDYLERLGREIHCGTLIQR